MGCMKSSKKSKRKRFPLAKAETTSYPDNCQLKEKLGQMDRDCEFMLTKDEKPFVEECFELLMDANSKEEEYVYHCGLLDCVMLLKWLGVLA